MIEVKLYLYDRDEREILNRALDEIAVRRLRAATYVDHRGDAIIPPDVEGNATIAAPCGTDAAAVVDTLTPDVTVEDAMRRYLGSNGIVKARALLETFGVKRVTDIPQDKHSDFLAAVRA